MTAWTKISTARGYGWNVRKECHGWTVGRLTASGFEYTARAYKTKADALRAAFIRHTA